MSKVELNKTAIYAYIDHQVESAIDNQLLDFLKSFDLSSLFLPLSYITKELVANAFRANLKRVHFKIMNLDINSPIDYRKGIVSFKENLKNLDKELFRESKNLHTYIKIDFKVEDTNNFVVSVTNNVSLLPVEKSRIIEKIEKAKTINNMEVDFSKLLDEEEGSGLGIIIILLTLKKLGLSSNNFKVISDSSKTTVEVVIPFSSKKIFEDSIISEEVIKFIDELPPFPQHITELQKNLSDPNTNFRDLIKIIIKDPPLIAKILKVANSSLYMLSKEIKTIDEAVRIIGFEGIKSIVFAYNLENLLSNIKKSNLKIIQQIIQHSIDVGFYSFKIAKVLNSKEDYSKIYMAATLHDIGKIIIHTLNPSIIEKLTTLCNSRGINLERIENAINDLNHAIIGAEIAKKWNFPSYIIDIIKNHHSPLLCEENNREILYLVYLADVLFYFKDGKFDLNKIHYEPLAFFSLTEKGKLENLFSEIISGKSTKS